MKQPLAVLLAAALAVQAGAAVAQSYEAAILAQLRQEGYAQITMTTTFLGRIRIIAEGAKGQREIVLNPRTGEVLRDVWLVSSSNSGKGGSGKSGGSTKGSSSGSSSGDDGDEDGNDDGDDGDDDNSGSGGGGHGSDDNSGGDDDSDDDGGDDHGGGDDGGDDD